MQSVYDVTSVQQYSTVINRESNHF